MQYSVGKKTFEDIRKNNCLYIDKTDFILDLLYGKPSFYLLSRPHGFGKTLFLSTLQAFFENRRELFKGLMIDRYYKNWKKIPVLAFDFWGNYSQFSDLENTIEKMLQQYENIYGITELSKTYNERLCNIIKTANTSNGENVAILVDNYDKPVSDNFYNLTERNKAACAMRNLFCLPKNIAQNIRFAFFTSVMPFSQMGAAKELSNFFNISLEPRYESVCGFSEDELPLIKPNIEELAEHLQLSYSETLSKLKAYYGGYSFSDEFVINYNPADILQSIETKQIKNFWNDNGATENLSKALEKYQTDFTELEGIKCAESTFVKPSSPLSNFVSALYQNGYLTIKRYNLDLEEFYLGFPNKAAAQSFAKIYFEVKYGFQQNINTFKNEFHAFCQDENIDNFLTSTATFFNEYSQTVENIEQKDCRIILYTILKAFGAEIYCTPEINLGQNDILLVMQQNIFTIYLKFSEQQEDKFRPVDKKRVAWVHQKNNQSIIKTIVNFSSDCKYIVNWQTEEFN